MTKSSREELAVPAPEDVEVVARAIDPVAWKFIDAHENDEPPHPAVPLCRARILEQAQAAVAALPSLGYAKRDEVPEDDGEEMQACEHCGAEVPLEEAVSSGDCWYCQKCFAAWRAEFDACEHDWELEPHYSEHGEEGRYCKKCSGFVANEDAEALGIALKSAAPSQEKP